MCETCVLLPHTSPIIMRYHFQKMACLLLNNNRLLYLFINIDKGYCFKMKANIDLPFYF